MSTRSKIGWVVFGVIVGIAFLLLKALVSATEFGLLPELAFTAMAVVGLIVFGCWEISKIRWLGLAEQKEKGETEALSPAEVIPSPPPTDSIKPIVAQGSGGKKKKKNKGSG